MLTAACLIIAAWLAYTFASSTVLAPHALTLTLWTAAVMALINAVMGLLTAYVLVRYRFPGEGLLNAIVDLPFAIPTLVAGVTLVVLYGPQSAVGAWFNRDLGLQIIFAPPGIVLALLFVTFPFVVRAVQPVLLSLDRAQEAISAKAPSTIAFWISSIRRTSACSMMGTCGDEGSRASKGRPCGRVRAYSRDSK